MKYVSTRDNSKEYNFEQVFIKGLADDGGLFIPKTLNKFSKNELKLFENLSYKNLAKEIIFPFIGDFMSKNELSKIVDNSYSVFSKENVIDIVDVGDIKILELFHGPTLAFKDIAMQVIGNMYDYLKVSKEKIVNINMIFFINNFSY